MAKLNEIKLFFLKTISNVKLKYFTDHTKCHFHAVLGDFLWDGSENEYTFFSHAATSEMPGAEVRIKDSFRATPARCRRQVVSSQTTIFKHSKWSKKMSNFDKLKKDLQDLTEAKLDIFLLHFLHQIY